MSVPVNIKKYEFNCDCGRGFKYFSSYKKHFLICISNNRHPGQQLINTNPEIVKSTVNVAAGSDTARNIRPSIKKSDKIKCVFCNLNINSSNIINHTANICQKRYKNTAAYIELSKLGLINDRHTNKEIWAMCLVIDKLLDLKLIKS